ncbi:MAG: ATP-binding cassette domain-containing protein [Proteobacteria bacterium]|nr:ATP-binding cassette domain-containing protein [Pseudomonadota bacterium]
MKPKNGRRDRERPLITLDSVTLKVGGKSMFENTEWTISVNQQWAVVGPNGSGKSVLAKGVMRTVPVVRGRISYGFDGKSESSDRTRSYFDHGQIVTISPESHGNLIRGNGYHQARWNSIEGLDVPLVSEILTGKSIERVSSYQVGPTMVGEDVYKQRREAAVRLLRIDGLLERKILHLSNGEARKVLIVRALMQSPELLILDDPFCGLDNDSRDNLKKIVDDLFAAGDLRILLLTSRLDEIPSGITHILQVAGGRIVRKGPKDEILQNGSARTVFGPPSPASDESETDFPVFPRENFPLEPEEKDSVPIDMTNVSVSYGGVRVLQGLNWTVKRGENWAVLGHNGAGKTTLLSLILADNPQSYSNEIRLFGRKRGSGERIWDIKRRIGWVSPELQVYYEKGTSCLNVVRSGFFDSVGLYQNCPPELTEVASRWMHALGIADLADRSLGTVSIGEQRLVLLARSLVKNPELLILDEPCQGLDVYNRTRIIRLLDRLCRQISVNLVYITHHFDEMPEAITHVLKLKQGRIEAKGERKDVLRF